jgi:ABC-type glycerol-3-phosphate transport system substrate-binding protein
VLSGKTDDEYKAAAAYLAFLATTPKQKFLLENPGDVPVIKSTYQALDTAVSRGNELLARFAQTYKGKSFP